MKPSLPDWVQPGVSFRARGERWHVRGLVDDQAVCRRWRSEKQWWHYECIDPFWFEIRGGKGVITDIRADDKTPEAGK